MKKRLTLLSMLAALCAMCGLAFADAVRFPVVTVLPLTTNTVSISNVSGFVYSYAVWGNALDTSTVQIVSVDGGVTNTILASRTLTTAIQQYPRILPVTTSETYLTNAVDKILLENATVTLTATYKSVTTNTINALIQLTH